MTRMWIGVDPSELCDQHLLGEHSELHQEVGTLRNHPHGEAVVRGHVEKGQVVLAHVRQRHADLAREMARRGMNHDSPLAFDRFEDAPRALWDRDEHSEGTNRDALKHRCDDCQSRMAKVAKAAVSG